MIGISTCWWNGKLHKGEELFKELLAIPVDGIELEYRIPEPLFNEIKDRLKKEINIISIHNFFPFPEEFLGKKRPSGDLIPLSCPDRYEREIAIKLTKRTIEVASELEARYVILHLGYVEMDIEKKDFYKRLMEKDDTEDYIKKLLKEKEEKRQRYMDSVLLSIDALNREAIKREVFLGIENRYYPHEIPDFKELGIILKEFEGGNVGYWHDMGHAIVQENANIIPQDMLLKTYADYLLGVHVHDVKGFNDHLPPGRGKVDFGRIARLLKEGIPKVLEVESHFSIDDIISSLGVLKESGIR